MTLANQPSQGISVITPHEAVVKTATVGIRTLTVSGKQVTLAVFRQLLNERLLDPYTADLAGVPWGRVNYFPSPCAANHLHIVWQTGDNLRRACVYPRRDQDVRADEAETQRYDAWRAKLLGGMLALREALSPGFTPPPEWSAASTRWAIPLAAHPRTTVYLEARYPVDSDVYPASSIPTSADTFLEHRFWPSPGRHARYFPDEGEYREESKAEWTARHAEGALASIGYMRNALRRLAELLRIEPDCDDSDLWELFGDACNAREAMAKHTVALDERWLQQYRALAALDQLFIAV